MSSREISEKRMPEWATERPSETDTTGPLVRRTSPCIDPHFLRAGLMKGHVHVLISPPVCINANVGRAMS